VSIEVRMKNAPRQLPTSSPRRLMKLVVPAKLRGRIREYLVAKSVTHIYGPERIPLSSDEAVVTCVVKNGEFYIREFIQHYSQVGFKHIFFLDNGSTDQTVAIAKGYSNVSVCQSTLPIDSHQVFFKRYLAKQSARGGWCLDADIDEFFDYPSSGVIGLREFFATQRDGIGEAIGLVGSEHTSVGIRPK